MEEERVRYIVKEIVKGSMRANARRALRKKE